MLNGDDLGKKTWERKWVIQKEECLFLTVIREATFWTRFKGGEPHGCFGEELSGGNSQGRAPTVRARVVCAGNSKKPGVAVKGAMMGTGMNRCGVGSQFIKGHRGHSKKLLPSTLSEIEWHLEDFEPRSDTTWFLFNRITQAAVSGRLG